MRGIDCDEQKCLEMARFMQARLESKALKGVADAGIEVEFDPLMDLMRGLKSKLVDDHDFRANYNDLVDNVHSLVDLRNMMDDWDNQDATTKGANFDKQVRETLKPFLLYSEGSDPVDYKLVTSEDFTKHVVEDFSRGKRIKPHPFQINIVHFLAKKMIVDEVNPFL